GGAPRLRQVRGEGLEHPRSVPALLLVASALRPCPLPGLVVRAQEARARLAAPRLAGHPRPSPRARAVRPPDPDRPRGPGPPARGPHPARPRLRGRRLRPPGRPPVGRPTRPARALRRPKDA